MSAPATSLERCPGASIRITREDLRDMQRQGERFTTDSRVPGSGYGTARVHCSNTVERMPEEPHDPLSDRPALPQMVAYYGLCHSCSALELDNRNTIRARNLPPPRHER